jgi:hypothetical protein
VPRVQGFGAVDLLGWTPDALDLVEHLRGWTEPAIERLELGWLPDQRRVLIPIRDDAGVELGELRYDPTGERQPKMLASSGSPRALFPPPELLADDELGKHRTVWLVEGEPDAIRLWSLGLPAVATPGAGNWRDEWAARFTGRHWTVIVCFDCDQAGRTGATRAATAIVRAGGDARLLDLDPTRDDGYDLTDFAHNADTPELRAGAATLLTAIADSIDLHQPEPSEGEPGEPSVRPWRSIPWSTFRDQAPEEHRWLIDGLLPAGVLCFIAGPPKRGKTWVGIGLALALALGRPFAGEHLVPTARDVLYIALEGSQTGLRTRIGALARGHQADPDSTELERLHMLYRPRPFDLAELTTSDWLLQEATDVDARLVFVDVLRAAARFQENVAEDFARIRDHLDPLLHAERTVVLLHHFGKLNDTQKERSPGERMAGTGAMYGALDVGFLITRSEDGARRLGVVVEARDFAAPDALQLAIAGEGGGKHGGFRYADTATLIIDEPDEVDYVASAETELEDEPAGLSRDALAERIGSWKLFEPAIAADTERRAELGEPPRIVRWKPADDADGRFPGVDAQGRRRQKTYAPYLTFARYEDALAAAGPTQPSIFGDGIFGDGRSDPELAGPNISGDVRSDPELAGPNISGDARSGPGPTGPNISESGDELGPEMLGPPTGGDRVDRASPDRLDSGGDPTEPPAEEP